MNIPYIDLTGSNQYKRHIKRIFGLTPRAWKLIILVLLILFILSSIAYWVEMAGRSFAMFERNTKVYAQTAPREYKAPVLADQTTQEAMIAVIKKVWRRDWNTGVAIARCESGLRPDAFNGHNKNGTWDAGLFQVNTIHGISKEDLMNPYANAGYAYAIYKEQGIQPWYSSNSCHGLLD